MLLLLGLRDEVEEKCGARPVIHEMPVSDQAIQHMVAGFWCECGVEPLFHSPEGMDMIRQLRLKILASAQYAEVMEGYDRAPKAPARSAAIYGLQTFCVTRSSI